MSLSRRSFLGAVAAAPFAASAALRGQKNKIPVGLELYSVRDDLAKDLLGTVTAVGKMGYEVVEFYSPYMQWTVERAKEVRKTLDGSGLKCLSTHNSANALSGDDMKKAVELNQIIGSRNLIVASAPRAATADAWKAFADRLAAASAELKPLGMATGYHNHQVEWSEVDGKRPMDIIAANTPNEVTLQFDVGTCLEVGADPIAWINANPGRIRSMHCKDWSMERGYDVAFGEGSAPWKRIFDAVERTGGVEYYLVEQETGAKSVGELAMVARCLENWKKLRG